MSYSKTRTTYHASTYTNCRTGTKTRDGIHISIDVFPAPTYAELENMRNSLPLPLDANSEEGRDQTAWKHALNMEIIRCGPPPAWSKKEQETPTQHARINPAQTEQLKNLLKPETLRRRFISMPALMAQIQSDVQFK